MALRRDTDPTVTFTFGGLRIDPDTAQVLNTDLAPMPGLYAAGELVGGLSTSTIRAAPG
jgi:predicted oxidoreductase